MAARARPIDGTTRGHPAGRPARERPVELAALLVLLALTVAAALPAIDAPFTYDETAGVAGNRAVRPGASAAAAIAYRYSPDQMRPVFFLSLLADANLSGMQPRGFRITNLVLHLLCGLCVHALLRRVAGSAAALAGTAVFLLHPLQTESALYVWGRSEILSTLLGLSALRLVPRGAARPAMQGQDVTRISRHAGALVCLALALGAKEEAIVLPLIAFIWWTGAERRSAKKAAIEALILCIPVVVFMAARVRLLGAAGRQVFARTFFDNLLGQAVVSLRMARLWLLPYGQSVDHQALVPALLPGLAALLLCAAVVVAAALLTRTGFDAAGAQAGRLLGAGILVAAAGDLIYWLVPLPDLMSERRAYLPMFGAALAVAAVAQWIAAPRAPAAGSRQDVTARSLLPAAALALALATLFRIRAGVWADPRRLWEEAARLAPDRPRAYVNLGVLAAERGEMDHAAEEFERAVTVAPDDPEALFNRARLRLDRGDLLGAESDLESAVAAGPRLTIAWVNLGLARLRLGKLTAAEKALRSALDIDPGDPRALTNLGEILRAGGRTEEAIALYRQSMLSDPGYAYAAARLGVTLEAKGDRAGALLAYREALRRGPANDTDRQALLAKVRSLESGLSGPAAPVR